MVLAVKNQSASAGDMREEGSIPGWGRSSGGGHGNPLQYAYLENPRVRGVWWATCSSWWSQRVGHDWAAKHKYKSDLLQKIIALGLLADGCIKFSFLNIK